MVVALACIVGLIFGVVYVLKRLMPGSISSAADRISMQILGQISLGSRQRVCALRVQGRTLLIGITEESINTLAELSTQSQAAQKEADDPKIFADLLSWRKDGPAAAPRSGASGDEPVRAGAAKQPSAGGSDDGPRLFAPGERPSR